MADQRESNFVEVKKSDLKEETLRKLVETFVLQEGTDYGHTEYSLEDKVEKVIKQIDRKKAWIIYDSKSEHCFISCEPLCF